MRTLRRAASNQTPHEQALLRANLQDHVAREAQQQEAIRARE